MRLIIEPNYEQLSKWAANYVAAKIKAANPTAEKPFVLGLPTGSSPLGMYKNLIELNKQGVVSFQNVITFNMDEYVGLPKDHPESYHSFMWNNFFSHIDIKPENVNILNGNAEDLEAECASYEARMKAAFDKSAEVHDLALKAVESVGGRELQTLEVYVRSIPMEKGFALKQDFKHLSPYECGLGWAVAADKDFIGKEAALARKEHPKYRMVGLEFSRESTEDISIWERVYWYGVEVGRCAQTIYGYTVDKNIGFATVRADVPDGAELTVGCNDSPAVVVNKVFC